jgi:uncharacterized protein DUF3224
MSRGVNSRNWVLVAALLALFASRFLFFPGYLAYAKEATGTDHAWVACRIVSESRQDGENRQITVTVTEKFTGMLNGNLEGTEHGVVHKDGTQSFSGSGTFVGAINGRSGTAILTYSGAVDVHGTIAAHWVVDKGTDDLARVDGQGTIEGKQTRPSPNDCDGAGHSAWNGTYSGTVQFAR